MLSLEAAYYPVIDVLVYSYRSLNLFMNKLPSQNLNNRQEPRLRLLITHPLGPPRAHRRNLQPRMNIRHHKRLITALKRMLHILPRRAPGTPMSRANRGHRQRARGAGADSRAPRYRSQALALLEYHLLRIDEGGCP